MKIVSLQIIAALVVAENTDVYHSKEQLSVQSSPQKGYLQQSMTEVFVILMVEVASIMHDCMSMKNIPSGVEPYIHVCNHNIGLSWLLACTLCQTLC